MVKFYSPIGTREQRLSHQIWPQGWIDAAPYAVRYRVGTPQEAYHTGADLNLNTPTWDLDAHSPVYSMGPGVVTYAKFFSSGWGNLIIVKHESPDGLPLYARYAHVENIQCSAGQIVTWETQLAQVGRINTESPFHLHFDISRTEILRTDPGHWPKLNRSLVLFHYVDPKKFLKDHATEGVPMPDSITLYVQPLGGLRLRSAPNGLILRNAVPQNTQVNGFETQQLGNILWQRVTFSGFAGWMGAREGTAIYLAPTPVGQPPIPTGPTPLDGKNALWFWHPSASSVTALLNTLPDSANAIIVKTSDGATWHGEADGATPIDIRSIEDVDKWVRTAAVGGIDFHAWAVLQGQDVDGESQRIIDVCRVPNVRSLILDIEPYAQFWSGPRENVKAIMQKVRAAIPAGFHIGLSIDPRPQHYASIFPDEWKPFVDSVHPQCYWATFEQPPADVLRSAYNTWSGFGKPIIPVLQGNADVSDIELAIDTARSVYKAQGLSFWRYGVMSAEQLAAIGDEPPEPEPVETLQTIDRINVRSKPSTAGIVRRVLDKGAIVKAQGHYMGAGANDWARLPDEPMESYAARDFMRTPVIVTDPIEDMETVAALNIRAQSSVTADKVGVLPLGARVKVQGNILSGDYHWTGLRDHPIPGYVAREYLRKPIAVPPPPAAKWLGGGHICEDNMRDNIIAAAQAGFFQSVTVINDWGFANQLLEWVPIVILRRARSVSDPQPHIIGDADHDYNLGRQWVTDPFHWDIFPMSNERVYLQFANEQNGDDEGPFYEGVIDRLKEMGRLGVVLNHAIGTTGLNYVNGMPVCPKWMKLRPMLEKVKRYGMLCGMHLYGMIDAHFHPVSAFDDPPAFPWFGGSVFACYSLMPPEAQPDLVITECGPGKSEWQRERGIDACWKDMVEFNKICLRYPYMKAFNWWNIGARNPAFGFAGDWIDDWLPELVQRQRALFGVTV